MDEFIDLEVIRKTYPYMDKTCGLCIWAHPSANLEIEDDWCEYFDKDVPRPQPACDFFVNRYIQYFFALWTVWKL